MAVVYNNFFQLVTEIILKKKSLRKWRLLLLKYIKKSCKRTKTFYSKTNEIIRTFENLSASSEALKTDCKYRLLHAWKVQAYGVYAENISKRNEEKFFKLGYIIFV